MPRFRILGAVIVMLAVGATCGGQESTPRPPSITPPEEKSVEQLLDQLDSLRARQAELDQARNEIVDQLRRKLRQKEQRPQKAGINTEVGGSPPSATPVAEPAAHGKGVNPEDSICALWAMRLVEGVSTEPSGSVLLGIRGRLFLFHGEQNVSHFEKGTSVVVDLYRVEKRLETWELSAAVLNQLRRKDGFGSGYDLTLPWANASPGGGAVRLKVRYKGPGGKVLEHVSEPITLTCGKGED